jgi:hypothetical protein
MDKPTNGKRSRGNEEQTGNKGKQTRKTGALVSQIDLEKLIRLQSALEVHPSPLHKTILPTRRMLRMPPTRIPTYTARQTQVRVPEVQLHQEKRSSTSPTTSLKLRGRQEHIPHNPPVS